MTGQGPEFAMRARIEETADRLPLQIGGLVERERAAVLMLSNLMLDLAARTWSPELREDPASAHPRSSDIALRALAESRDQLAEAARWAGKDPATIRQSLATDLCILTIGFPRAPATFKALGEAWRGVWGARAHLGEALLAFRDWERATGIDAFPPGEDGRRQNDATVLAAASRFPGFFRRKRAA
jgi:hypothetical protein